MKPKICIRRNGFTLFELLISMTVGLLCLGIVLEIAWTGMRAMTRNTSVNLAHLNVVAPMQRLTDDVHSALTTGSLTGPLLSVASGSVVPTGFPGNYTKGVTSGTMISPTFTAAASNGTCAGVGLYLMVSSPYSVSNTTGTYSGNAASFSVANGTYDSASKTIDIELQTSGDKTLFLSAINGMHLCIPAAGITTGSNTVMLDQKITGVTVVGTAATSLASSTLVATCTLAGALGVKITANGTRNNNSAATVQAYLAAPVNYFVCGEELIRLNYDGYWEVVMRNVVSADNKAAQATPFRLPYPYSVSPLSSGTDGQRAVTVRMAASNPDYGNNLTLRGANSNMLLYDFTVWSRMQSYDEMSR